MTIKVNEIYRMEWNLLSIVCCEDGSGFVEEIDNDGMA